MTQRAQQMATLAEAYDGVLLTILDECKADAVSALLAADPADHMGLVAAQAAANAAGDIRQEFERQITISQAASLNDTQPDIPVASP